MTDLTKLGATRAAFLSAASALPILRGPTIPLAPDDDLGGGGGGEAPVAELTDDNPSPGGAEPGEAENPGDDPPAEREGEEGDQPKKPKQSAQERIDELTRQRRDAERRAERAERALASSQTPKEGEEGADKAPDPTKYEFGDADPAYIRDLARHEAKQAYAEERQQAAQQARVEAVEAAWDERVAAFETEHPDFHEKTQAEGLPISPAMAAAIRTAEGGPAVAYHLATNPDEARRIADLPPYAQIREIGRLEGRLEQSAPGQQQPTPKTISDAPKPAPQTRGSGGRFVVAADTDDFEAFERAHGTK